MNNKIRRYYCKVLINYQEIKLRALLKKFLPSGLRNQLHSLIKFLRFNLVKIFKRNGMLASFYYFFLSKEFQREHVSTLAGIHAYSKSLDHPSRSSALLRRSIHRIEKGLIMRPRRNTFAADYIKETVDIFVQCLYNVFKSYYGDYLLPEGYNQKIKILIEKEKSNKIKFRMMDILDRK